jgi:hypothetical protein
MDGTQMGQKLRSNLQKHLCWLGLGCLQSKIKKTADPKLRSAVQTEIDFDKKDTNDHSNEASLQYHRSR